MKKGWHLFLSGIIVLSGFNSIFFNFTFATSTITHLNEPPTFTTTYYFVPKGETLISDTIATDDDNVVLEFGNVNLSGNTPQLVSHSQMCNPVVVATIRGKNAAEVQRTPRVWDKSSTGFILKVDNYNGNPPASTYVAYLVAESGAYNIGPMHIQAGSQYTEFVYSRSAQITNGTPVYFSPSFIAKPAVVHTVTSSNDPNWVTSSVNGNDNSRISEPSPSQMSVFLQRSWASNVHSGETIDYIAVEPGHYNINGIEIDAGQSADIVEGSNDSGYNVSFNSSFASVPQTFLTSQLGEDGGDGGFAQFHSGGIATTGTFPAVIDEDGPGADRTHITETVGFIVFSSSSGVLTEPNILTYSLSGGADVDKFQLSSTGVLSFLTGQDGDNPTDANGDAIYEVGIKVCDSHCVPKCSFEIIQVEVDKKPILTLNGSGVIDIVQGQTFVDPGATCYDAHDGTCPVVVSGSVDNLTIGTYTLWYTATDSNGNEADPVFRIVNVLPPSTIVSGSVNVEPYETGALITWETTQKATSQVNYGLTSRLGDLTPEFDVSNKLTGHRIVLTGLLPCTEYFFEVISIDEGNNEVRDGVYNFITKGCPGGASVIETKVSDVVYTWSGATGANSLYLGTGSSLVKIEVPVGYFDVGTGSCGGTGTLFQLKQLQKEPIVNNLGHPIKPVVIRAYEFSAYCKEDEKVHIFDRPITISINYADSDLVGVQEKELEIFRYDELTNNWVSLDNCLVDQQANLISCETNHFSSFALSTIATPTLEERAYGGVYRPIDYCLGGDKSGDLYDGKCEPSSTQSSDTLSGASGTGDVYISGEDSYKQISEKYLDGLREQYLDILEDISLLEYLKNKWKAPQIGFVLPEILPQTGTPIEKRTYRRKVSTIEVNLPSPEIFRLSGTYIDDIHYRTKVLPTIDQGKRDYIVIPSNGLVMPIERVPNDSDDFKAMVLGKQIDINKYLRNGAMYYPTTESYLGKSGNVVIFGHSSYWKNDPGRYKTQFQKIIELDPGEEVRIFSKLGSGKYERYTYVVESSYETSPTDVGVLKPTKGSMLTLFTCTPIGGIAKRWIVRAKLKSYKDIEKKIYELENKIYGYNVPYKYRNFINKVIIQKINPLSENEKRKKIPNMIKKIDDFLKREEISGSMALKNTLEYLKMKLLLSLFEGEE